MLLRISKRRAKFLFIRMVNEKCADNRRFIKFFLDCDSMY